MSVLLIRALAIALALHAATAGAQWQSAAQAVPTPRLIRGPYLQQGTPDSMIVRWRTDAPGDSRVRYGLTPDQLSSVADDPVITTEHEVVVTGLSPLTRYWYAVETSGARVGGGTPAFFFVTSPTPGLSIPTRIWALGDSGTGLPDARAVRDAYYATPRSGSTNVWLMLGDNAYQNGTDQEYQTALFDMYPEMLRHTVLWPAIGNHDTGQIIRPPAGIPYDLAFTLPSHGEAGGVASGTERYYSFDYGNIHFIALDSMTSDRSFVGPMLTWLRADLAATRQPWIIAYWHHPPYSKGSHNSDLEPELIAMRENAVPILEQGGVDLVLCGHSHDYERSFLLSGHYGFSSSFTSSMKLDGGDGRIDGTGAYRKGTTATSSYRGTVYVVAGTSATATPAPLDHPAMQWAAAKLGSLVLDVDGNRLDATFLRDDRSTPDHFTILKTMPVDPPSAPSAVRASATSHSVVLSWTDTSPTESGFRIERCTGAECATFETVGQTPGDATTFVDASVTPSTVYRYRVFAANASGQSSPSGIVQATTYAGRRRAVSH